MINPCISECCTACDIELLGARGGGGREMTERNEESEKRESFFLSCSLARVSGNRTLKALEALDVTLLCH